MNTFYSIFLRGQFVVFWLAIIFSFLFFPSVALFWHARDSINIMTWADLLDPVLIEKFEQESGIKVYQSYFESNEELYARFRATGGKGHDLILPSDFMVEILINDGLLKLLDKSQLQSIWPCLDTRLLNLYYDPESAYSIPYYWAVYGIGYNRNFFHDSITPDWEIIFNDCSSRTLVMPESAREVIFLAAHYLFGSLENLSIQKLEKIKNLLLKQKSCVGAYSETRADHLLITQEFPMAIVPTAVFWRALQQYHHLDFTVPSGKTFVMIDNFAIPKESTKETLVYKFLNFLYQQENICSTFDRRRFLPATANLTSLLQEAGAPLSIIEAHARDVSSWQFFKNTILSHSMEQIWIVLKAE